VDGESPGTADGAITPALESRIGLAAAAALAPVRGLVAGIVSPTARASFWRQPTAAASTTTAATG
jgi:hypothetical protein